MTEFVGPHLGVKSGYELGEDGWKAGMEANLRLLDALLHASVKSAALTAPPGSPANGDAYIVAASATGTWATHDGAIAVWRSATGTVGAAWAFYPPTKGLRVYNEATTHFVYYDTSWADEPQSVAAANPTESLVIPICGETVALATGVAAVTFRMPYAFTLTGVRGSLSTAQTSGSILTIDINEGGASILSTKLTIDNTEKTSTTAAAAAVVSDASLADDAEVTIDVDQIGDGTAKGGKVTLIGHRT